MKNTHPPAVLGINGPMHSGKTWLIKYLLDSIPDAVVLRPSDELYGIMQEEGTAPKGMLYQDFKKLPDARARLIKRATELRNEDVHVFNRRVVKTDEWNNARVVIVDNIGFQDEVTWYDANSCPMIVLRLEAPYSELEPIKSSRRRLRAPWPDDSRMPVEYHTMLTCYDSLQMTLLLDWLQRPLTAGNQAHTMELSSFGTDTSQPVDTNPLAFFRSAELPGSWADWAQRLATSPTTSDSGAIFRHAESLAKAAAISTEAATALLLWLGSVSMIHHAQIQWPSGIWQPAGLTLSIVEEDNVPVESIVNSFIQLARDIGIDPINDTVKEGPAGLIARLESAGSNRNLGRGKSSEASDGVDSLSALASLDTSDMAVREVANRGNARALIYPSGRTLLSYLYDTAFFNTVDDLIQHGNLNVRGKASNHRLTEVHMSTLTTFFQGALVTLTADNRVQNNMTVLLRQMLVLWPTSGTRRHTKQGRVDIALFNIQKVAQTGFDALHDLSDGTLRIPEMPKGVDKSLLDSDGAGIRYTVLNRETRIARLAIAVAFWRIADGGKFEITNSDMAIADSVLHMHEMGGRLFELAMAKGRMGHEFMRLFMQLLDGESIAGEELSQASEVSTGAAAKGRLGDMSVIDGDGKLSDEYRVVKGSAIAAHKKRWKLT